MQVSRDVCVLVVTVLLLIGGGTGSAFARSTGTDRNIQLYQRLLQRHPADAGAYYRLGDAYIQKARESGDITYYDLAEQALRKALDLAPHYGRAVRHLAYVLYSRHAFQEAAVQAAKAIELEPTDSHAYGVLGDAYLELGQYARAQEAYAKMLRLRADLYSYSRLSGLQSLQGDTQGAMATLARAIEIGRAHNLPGESIAWVQWQLGNEHFAVGNLQWAAWEYHAALETYPNYHRALTGLARVYAAQQQYPEAIALYQQALAIMPLPEYAVALGDVYARVNRPEEAAKHYALVEYIGYLNSLNKVLYNRELAAFYADHSLKLTEALALARQELEVRQDIYAYDLFAWALLKNGQPQEARIAITEALKLGTQDARLFFHAGMIYAHLGEVDQARSYLQRALTTNPYFHIVHADVATRTLQELGEGPD
jgi:tetratricopeptide (TPR) repeat protein